MNGDESKEGGKERIIYQREFDRHIQDYLQVHDAFMPELKRAKINVWQEQVDLLSQYLEPHEAEILETIIKLLRKETKGNRLTKDQLKLLAKSDMNFEIGDGPIKKTLAAATNKNILNNRSQGRNRGYGLPEWEWD